MSKKSREWGLVTVDTGSETIEFEPPGTAEQQPPDRCSCGGTCPNCGKSR